MREGGDPLEGWRQARQARNAARAEPWRQGRQMQKSNNGQDAEQTRRAETNSARSSSSSASVSPEGIEDLRMLLNDDGCERQPSRKAY